MKANRKFIRGDNDEAVSPVIAVILMVAITVVLAATVYVWVSGFGAQSSQPAKAIALTSAGAIDSTTHAGDFMKSYTVSSASPGMKYSDMSLALSGTPLTFASTACAPAANGDWAACSGTTARTATSLVSAGDTIIFRSADTPSGSTLRIVDPNSNSVMLTLTVS